MAGGVLLASDLRLHHDHEHVHRVVHATGTILLLLLILMLHIMGSVAVVANAAIARMVVHAAIVCCVLFFVGRVKFVERILLLLFGVAMLSYCMGGRAAGYCMTGYFAMVHRKVKSDRCLFAVWCWVVDD